MQEEEIQKTELEELAEKYDLTPQQQHQITAEELIPMNEEMTSKLTPEQQQWIAEFRKELKPYCDPRTLELLVMGELIHPEEWGPEWDPNNPTPAEVAELVLM